MLVDDHDGPFRSKLETENDTREMKIFFTEMYSDALKSNPSLYKGCLTGVAEVRFSDVCSGVNNLTVCSIANEMFGNCFGFTEEEVRRIMRDRFCSSDLECDVEGNPEWYGGYRCGKQLLVNPYSFARHPRATVNLVRIGYRRQLIHYSQFLKRKG